MGQGRLQGTACAVVDAPVEKVWKIAANFYELNKWVPTVRECYEIENGVRFVRTFPSPDGKVTWVKERLLALDGEKYSMRYEIVEGNMGLDGYDAILEMYGDDLGRTLVKWSFRMSSTSSKGKHEQEEFLRWGIKKLEEAAVM